MKREQALLAILGPTGTGKSALALDLARRYDGEIISADSRQVYRLLDIGTEKPSVEDRKSVPHHLVDLVHPGERYSVAQFVHDASAALEDIRHRGRLPIMVGGTGYYSRALLEGLSFPPEAGDLESEVQTMGVAAAISEIGSIDPVTAHRLDTANTRRVSRALALVRATGKPIGPVKQLPISAVVVGLTQHRAELYERLDRRVEKQMAAGLLAETQRVVELGYSPELPVLRGLAYGQMISHLQGKRSLEEAVADYKFATHALVRRQMTWFRRESAIQWIDVDRPGFEVRTAGMVERLIN